jgi:hypothetical protein
MGCRAEARRVVEDYRVRRHCPISRGLIRILSRDRQVKDPVAFLPLPLS